MVQHSFTGRNGRPGISAVVETFENVFLWGSYPVQQYSGLLIDASARDVGNSGTPEILRQGLLLGKIEATQRLTQWNPNATDGSEYIWGILNETVSMRALSGTQDRLQGFIVIAGGLQADRIIIPGSVGIGIKGNANEYLVRALLRANFLIDDSYQYSRPNGFIHRITAAEIAEEGPVLDISFIDSGKDFHYDANVTMRLPDSPIKGLDYSFYNEATTTLISGSANIRVPGSALVASLPVSGAAVTLVGTGTEWLVK